MFLANIESIHEQNCLIKYGRTLPDTWYWHDGKYSRDYEIVWDILLFLTAHLVDDVWVHTSTNEEVEWFSPKWFCIYDYGADDTVLGPHGGDAMQLYVGKDMRQNGKWCDNNSAGNLNYICKAKI